MLIDQPQRVRTAVTASRRIASVACSVASRVFQCPGETSRTSAPRGGRTSTAPKALRRSVLQQGRPGCRSAAGSPSGRWRPLDGGALRRPASPRERLHRRRELRALLARGRDSAAVRAPVDGERHGEALRPAQDRGGLRDARDPAARAGEAMRDGTGRTRHDGDRSTWRRPARRSPHPCPRCAGMLDTAAMPTPKRATKRTRTRPAVPPSPDAVPSFAEVGREAARDAQRKHLLRTLKSNGWNMSHTAEVLQMGSASAVIRALKSLAPEEYEAAQNDGRIRAGRPKD